jgi:hypothetical protein
MACALNIYPHRKGWDGMFNSICTNGLATIAIADSEDKLAEPDKNHVCDPKVLAALESDRFKGPRLL